jgi:chromate transporter
MIRHDFGLLWNILMTFMKISPVTFGGGFAMIPYLEKELVQRKKWMKKEEISDFFAVSQSVPGSVAVNSAIFIGYQMAGTLGAVTAMVGILLPTFLISITLATLFFSYQHHPIVQAAFLGIRPAVVALILFAAYNVGKTAILDKNTLFIVIGTVGFLIFTPIHPIDIILIGGAIGILLVKFKDKIKYLRPNFTQKEES